MDWAVLNEAARMVLGAGPWAAFCILLLAFCVFLVWALLKEGRLNREVHGTNNTVLTRLATLIEVMTGKGNP